MNNDLIREIIQGLYSRVGMFNTKIKIYSLVGLDRLDNRIESFSVKIKEGGYSKVQEVLFEGNSKVLSDELLKLLTRKDYLSLKEVSIAKMSSLHLEK